VSLDVIVTVCDPIMTVSLESKRVTADNVHSFELVVLSQYAVRISEVCVSTLHIPLCVQSSGQERKKRHSGIELGANVP
jgi:hypothetical protein